MKKIFLISFLVSMVVTAAFCQEAVSNKRDAHPHAPSVQDTATHSGTAVSAKKNAKPIPQEKATSPADPQYPAQSSRKDAK
jgi:hypothetical protein